MPRSFAPARRRSGKQSFEQRHVNLQRLESQPLSHEQVMNLTGFGADFGGAETPDIAAHADPAISIPGTLAMLRAGRIDQPAQRPSEVVDYRVARKACDDAALRPDQRHDRVVGEGVFVWCRAGYPL
jgi:hypothetical protein